ncbi:NAD-dependent epimerase/dehydratase family protein [Sphingobium sp. CAP-1]|uniref:NAD-dependent epimerase/dehydratase family protein n=1 Tax=Sphingobium sp. CAP-1 TaxID=2676077 RepID=UPI0012BB2051|nr:NAD-dependent epimerase/dehydratase family protein [Sphingobium sp. CAP-1]QGP80288.1 NAD-dependent epimerase/dehydratase family protein [Sphingobium sp. CAP-1]
MMAGSRKLVLVTGATGNMGRAVVDELLGTPDMAVRVLVRSEEKNHPVIRRLRKKEGVDFAWGDLTDAASVERAVAGVDVVLHMGALVSPLADTLPPALVEKVNVGGTRNVVEAIRRQPNADAIRLVYIGTVAQTGSRNAPIHWGRTGDPIRVGYNGHYAATKAKGEAVVAESGLKHWVSIRQTGMAHFDLWRTSGPIMFHNPVNGVMEWSTMQDSARLMAGVCKDGVPTRFWRHFYNIGGGVQARLVNHQFLVKSMDAMGIRDFRKILRPNWQATRNFHGQWYIDSDRLEELVPYRHFSLEAFFAELPKHIPWALRAFSRLFPGVIHKQIKRMSEAPGGSMHWIATGDKIHTDAYFGSLEEWRKLPESWDDFTFADPSSTPAGLDHGYDDAKAKDQWTIADLRQAAEFRGGRCHTTELGDPYAPVDWECSVGHRFAMSPNLYLAGGHWCPQCQTDIDQYEKAAATNPFFAQVWPGPSAGSAVS